MTFDKLVKLRRINFITFILMIFVNIGSFFININGKSNVNLMKERLPFFNYTDKLILPYGLVLIGLLFFMIFQSGRLKNRDAISATASDIVGWPFWQLNILNILQLVTFQLRIPILTLVISLVMAALLFIVNGNIKFDKKTNEEKLYVRNPFSYYLTWILFTIFSLIAYIFKNTFNGQGPMVTLLLAFIALLIFYGFHNNNNGILVFAIILNLFLYPFSTFFINMKYLWFIVQGLLIIAMYFIYKKNKKEETIKLNENIPFNG